MGWGEQHLPANTGTTEQIEHARATLAAVGVESTTLAGQAVLAAARIRALNDVAHRAWHLLDEGGEIPDTDDVVVSAHDARQLSTALDALEAGGWRSCEGWV